MWPKSYKDYSVDKPLIKEKVEPGKGIIGCEMHELNGWGTNYHYKNRKRGRIATFLLSLFPPKKKEIQTDDDGE